MSTSDYTGRDGMGSMGTFLPRTWYTYDPAGRSSQKHIPSS